jgi:hypothetical protein
MTSMAWVVKIRVRWVTSIIGVVVLIPVIEVEGSVGHDPHETTSSPVERSPSWPPVDLLTISIEVP